MYLEYRQTKITRNDEEYIYFKRCSCLFALSLNHCYIDEYLFIRQYSTPKKLFFKTTNRYNHIWVRDKDDVVLYKKIMTEYPTLFNYVKVYDFFLEKFIQIVGGMEGLPVWVEITDRQVVNTSKIHVVVAKGYTLAMLEKLYPNSSFHIVR